MGGLDRGNPHSISKDEIQVISATRRATLLYEASLLERKIRGCFFDSRKQGLGQEKHKS